ncbi:MAG: hypothetical protein RJA63_2326, partial [Pseudomonadota bacterium]
MYLGAVQADIAEFEQFHFPGQFKHLNKQFGEFAKKPAPERGYTLCSGCGLLVSGFGPTAHRPSFRIRRLMRRRP